MNATDEETQIDKDFKALYRRKKKLIKKLVARLFVIDIISPFGGC